MISEHLFTEKLTELSANFSKIISSKQVDFIGKLTKKYTDKDFEKKIDALMENEIFPRNLKRAFAGGDIQKTCLWDGCKLKGSIDKYCSWHHYCLEDVKRNNEHEFDEWVLERIDYFPHNPDDKLHKKNSPSRRYLDEYGKEHFVPIERMCDHCNEKNKILKVFTWGNVN